MLAAIDFFFCDEEPNTKLINRGSFICASVTWRFYIFMEIPFNFL